MRNPQVGRLSVAVPLLVLGAVVLRPLPLAAQKDKPGQVVFETRGHVVPGRQVTVSPRIAGQVVQLLVEEGERVKEGQVLARLDPAEHEANVRLAHAELKLAEAGLARARAAEGKADLAIAQAKIDVARARLDLARHRLDCTVVRAPFNGIVLAKRAEVGALINPKGFQGSVSLCELADPSTMEVELWIQEKDLGRISRGQPCLIRLEAFPKTTYRGRVARLLPVADRAKGAVGVRVRLEVPERDEALRPDMAALVRIMARE
jgi:RND family efflux transporter MFP subunit